MPPHEQVIDVTNSWALKGLFRTLLGAVRSEI